MKGSAENTQNSAVCHGQLIAYIRVSSTDQNTARQEESIKALNPVKTFTDRCSGKNTDRPMLTECLNYLREGDTLVVHSIDRLCRNVSDLLRIVNDFKDRGITLRFLKEGIETSGNNPMNDLILTIIGAIAGFERELIKERQREGIAVAKAAGAYSKVGRKEALTPEQKAEIRAHKEAGMPIAQIAREYKVSRNLIYNALKA